MTRSTTIGLLLALCTPALLATDSSAAQSKAAASPEEAVKNVQAAMQAGDALTLLDQLAAPSRTLFEGMMTFRLAREDFDRAVAEKFGKDTKNPLPPTLTESLKHTRAIRVVTRDDKDKDKVALTVWVTEDHDKDKRTLEQNWFAVKDADAWRLLVPFSGGKTKLVMRKGPDGKDVPVHVFEREGRVELSGRESDFLRTSGPKYKALLGQVAKDVRGGVYKTRGEAEKALQRAEERFRQENPLPVVEKGER